MMSALPQISPALEGEAVADISTFTCRANWPESSDQSEMTFWLRSLKGSNGGAHPNFSCSGSERLGGRCMDL